MKTRTTYKMLESLIKKRIIGSEWKPNEKIPSCRDFSKQYECSINTVEKAMKSLEETGIVLREERKRTIIHPNMAQKKVGGLIAAFVLSIDHPYWSSALRGIETYLYDFGFSIITISHEKDMEKMGRSLGNVINLSLDGVIIVPFDHNPEEQKQFNDIIAELQKRNIKIVFLDRFKYELDIPYVTTDNSNSAYKLTKHLIDNGHQKIAFVHGSRASSVEERFSGYKRACYDQGIPANEDYDFFIPTQEEDFQNEMEDFIEMFTKRLCASDVTALFAANDQYARGILIALERLHLEVPRDISLVSYDVSTVPASHKVTGIKQNFYEMGRVCAEILLNQIYAQTASTTTGRIIPASMVIGESVRKLIV